MQSTPPMTPEAQVSFESAVASTPRDDLDQVRQDVAAARAKCEVEVITTNAARDIAEQLAEELFPTSLQPLCGTATRAPSDCERITPRAIATHADAIRYQIPVWQPQQALPLPLATPWHTYMCQHVV